MSVAPSRKPYPPTTPAARALNVVGHKWALLIVQALENEPIRFVDLHRGPLAGISTEQLRTCLNRLVADGVLSRERFNESPPRVMYDLTPKGRAVLPVLDELGLWAANWTEDGKRV
jgi:DNA-binding HxlR family transcriptional regulator